MISKETGGGGVLASLDIIEYINIQMDDDGSTYESNEDFILNQ